MTAGATIALGAARLRARAQDIRPGVFPARTSDYHRHHHRRRYLELEYARAEVETCVSSLLTEAQGSARLLAFDASRTLPESAVVARGILERVADRVVGMPPRAEVPDRVSITDAVLAIAAALGAMAEDERGGVVSRVFASLDVHGRHREALLVHRVGLAVQREQQSESEDPGDDEGWWERPIHGRPEEGLLPGEGGVPAAPSQEPGSDEALYAGDPRGGQGRAPQRVEGPLLSMRGGAGGSAPGSYPGGRGFDARPRNQPTEDVSP